MRLLSTKILSQNFRDKLLMNQFSLVELAFIKISFLENPIIDGIFDRLIFTSQNAVNAVYSSPKIQKMIEGKITYCVGKKTASLLAENGQKTMKIAQNSLELAQFLAKNYKNESFSYFCGKLRIPDLEEILPVRGIHIKPIEVYTTHLQEHTVKGHFDGILFFSPSGCGDMPKIMDLKMSIVFVWETPPPKKLLCTLPNTPSLRSPVSPNFCYH